MPSNLFEQYLQSELMTLLQAVTSAAVVQGEGDEIIVYPRVVVNDLGGPEEVFESGIYRHTVEFIIKVNEVGETPVDEPPFCRTMLGQVLDFLQQTTLKQQLMASGLLFIHGIVLGMTHPLEIEDKIWSRKVECEFVGFSRATG